MDQTMYWTITFLLFMILMVFLMNRIEQFIFKEIREMLDKQGQIIDRYKELTKKQTEIIKELELQLNERNLE